MMPCKKMTKKQEREFGKVITDRLHEYEDIMSGKKKVGLDKSWSKRDYHLEMEVLDVNTQRRMLD